MGSAAHPLPHLVGELHLHHHGLREAAQSGGGGVAQATAALLPLAARPLTGALSPKCVHRGRSRSLRSLK